MNARAQAAGPCAASRPSSEHRLFTLARRRDQPGRPLRRRWSAGLLLLPLLVLASRPAAAQEVPALRITSKHYIVIDADTGEVFAQRAAHDEVAIASLTKVFTTIEALQRGDLGRPITTHASDVFDNSSTRMGFGSGETFTLKDLLYGMMLPSGNDAAHAIARALGYQPGDSDEQAVARYVGYMNDRVKNMGLTETHLMNPHGWGVKGHYSSAHDLATFTRYALQSSVFVNLISTPEYTTPNGAYDVTNTNKMLNLGFPGLIGGKTGYDDDAGYCLIEVARRDGSTMISVTLNGVAPNDWYDDNRVLLNYAFDQKAARLNAQKPITGEVLSFRDPDAARVIAAASPGASLGVALNPSNLSALGFGAGSSASPAPVQAATGNDPLPGNGTGSGASLLAPVVVAALIIVAGVLTSVLRGPTAATRRTMAKTTSSAGPPRVPPSTN